MYTPGFAAPEQYKGRENLGPWTDIYSIGASIFACMAGFAPQAADARLEDDRLVSAKKLWGGKYSNELLEIVDWCLQMNYLDRPQSVHSLQKALSPKVPEPAPKASMLDNLKKSLARIRMR